MPHPNWFVVYKSGSSVQKFKERLDQYGLEYFIPTILKEELSKDGKEMIGIETPAISNLVFIRTDKDIRKIVDEVDCLRAPFKDYATGKPAIVEDEEMSQFMTVINARQRNAKILRDPFSKFAPMQKVRVRGGQFEGLEGRIVRIQRDRQLVISLGTMAVAISGIHHSLLDPIE